MAARRDQLGCRWLALSRVPNTTAAGSDDPAAFPGSRNQFAIEMPPARVKQSLRHRRVRAALQMPLRCKEDVTCDFGDTKIGKRPRTFAGTEAANLGGTGFPPAGLLEVSSRRPWNDSSSGEVFLTVQDNSDDFRQGLLRGLTPNRSAQCSRARMFTDGHCSVAEGARLMAQGKRKAWPSDDAG